MGSSSTAEEAEEPQLGLRRRQAELLPASCYQIDRVSAQAPSAHFAQPLHSGRTQSSPTLLARRLGRRRAGRNARLGPARQPAGGRAELRAELRTLSRKLRVLSEELRAESRHSEASGGGGDIDKDRDSGSGDLEGSLSARSEAGLLHVRR